MSAAKTRAVSSAIQPVVGPVAVSTVGVAGNATANSLAASSHSGGSDEVAPGAQPLALSATALSGGGIRLSWLPLGLMPTAQIVVFRKSLNALDWDAPAIGEPAYDATIFDDLTAQTGKTYEYKVTYYTDFGSAGVSKYIYAGNQTAPQVDSRGTVLLVVDASQLDATRDAAGTTLTPALDQYKADLIADGYQVRMVTSPRVDVPRTPPSDLSPEGIAAYYAPWSNAVAAVKAQIRSVWQTTPKLSSVVLIGHVPVPYSGVSSPDGAAHVDSQGAWPADVYYSTLSTPDSLWTDEVDVEGSTGADQNMPGDGKFDQDGLNELGIGTDYENQVFSDVPIGRIDFAMMNEFVGVSYLAGSSATVGETQLISEYFAKNHAWRTGQVNVQRKALFEEQFPFPEYYDTNRLTPNVGIGNIVSGTVGPVEPLNGVTVAPTDFDLAKQSWLWMYAGAGGYPSRDVIHFAPGRELRTDQYANGIYATPGTFSWNIDQGPHRSVFNFIYGSYVGDWDAPNALLRGVIAEPDGLGLAVAWGARPNWDQHHMGLGETIGLSLQKTINNFGDRQAYDYSPYQSSTRLSLLGDPTLRQDNVMPASNVSSAPAAGGRLVSWTPSGDPAVSGYYVYRTTSASGPFTRLSTTATTSTSFLDTSAPAAGDVYYMVRAVELETTPSGSYWNIAPGAISAPHVTTNRFLNSGAAQSIQLVFDQPLSGVVSSNSFAIVGNRYNNATHTSVPTTLVPDVDFHLQTYDAATRTATLRFDTHNELNIAGTIASGRYSLKLAGAGVKNAFNVGVDPAYAFAFGYLVGDTNNDFRVDFADLVRVAQQYQQHVSGGPLLGDFNGDGVVDFKDLVTLAQYYNQSI